jgi:hypothetical protein
MEAPLNTCTTKEQCGVVRFLWAKDVAAKDIHKEMLPMYGEHCPSLHLSGERFPDDDVVERAMCAWFRQQPQEFYAAGFQRLVRRWDKCLNLWVYVEKLILFVCHYHHSFLFNHDL